MNTTFDSVTSSDFNNGIVLDLFDLESEMSKPSKKGRRNYCNKDNTSESKCVY